MGTGVQLVIGPPELFPKEPSRPAEEVLNEALVQAQENGIRRLSFNQEWRPENIAHYYAFHTGEKDKDIVDETLRRMGYEQGDKVRGDREEFKRTFFTMLDQVKSGESKVTGDGFWGE